MVMTNMVILGLGSNLGDRLANLRCALTKIKALPHFTVIQISPIYISDALLPQNAPLNWNTPYLNLAIYGKSTLSPYDLLTKIKEIEIAVGRKPEKNWGPRVIDIDILAWDDLVQFDEKLHIPQENLIERPFALWPLADVAPNWVHPQFKKTAATLIRPWGSRFDGKAPLHTQQIPHRIDTPQLMGIVNITPDSFSDGNHFFEIDAAVKHAIELNQTGAEIIDLGAESTGPNAVPCTPTHEWNRLEPVLKILLSERNQFLIPPKISVDTYHAPVAEKALEMGVDWINDVSGLTNPAMQDIIAQTTCDVVVMHHLSVPVQKNQFLPLDQDPSKIVYEWSQKQLDLLEKKGIDRQRIILDLGIGYGKTSEQSLELIRSIAHFKSLNCRLLIGHSRKSFLQSFTNTDPMQRDLETTILSLFLGKQNVDYLRVHNVDMHSRAFRVHNSATV